MTVSVDGAAAAPRCTALAADSSARANTLGSIPPRLTPVQSDAASPAADAEATVAARDTIGTPMRQSARPRRTAHTRRRRELFNSIVVMLIARKKVPRDIRFYRARTRISR